MKIDQFIPHVMTALVSISATLGIVLMTQPPTGLPTGIVTIDATEAVLNFIQSGGRSMPDADYQTEALKYQAVLEAAIADFARENSVIVVNGAAVLAGAPDITQLVSQIALSKAPPSGVAK